MNKKVITTTLTLGIFVVTTVILYRSSIDLGDWPLFHSVSQAVLRGGNPYLTQTIIDGVK